MENDIARSTRIQREANDAMLECLTKSIDEKSERTKLVLTALSAASVPLDILTASILHDLGCEMASVVRASWEEDV